MERVQLLLMEMSGHERRTVSGYWLRMLSSYDTAAVMDQLLTHQDYVTDHQLGRELGLSQYTTRVLLDRLEKRELVESKTMYVGRMMMKHSRVNWKVVLGKLKEQLEDKRKGLLNAPCECRKNEEDKKFFYVDFEGIINWIIGMIFRIFSIKSK